MKVTYLFDPLCGWCYGASEALEQIAHIDGLEVELAPTGLFAGEGSRPMDKQFANFAWQNDQRIARLTGQSFSESYRQLVLGATGSMLDSAPSTLAIVAVGLSEPSREREALKAIQRARYVEGRDNSEIDTVADILVAADFNAAAKRIRKPDEELMAAYRKRVQTARKIMGEFGAQGVPTLIVDDGKTRRHIPGNALFQGLDGLVSQLTASATA